MNLINTIKNMLPGANKWPQQYSYDVLPPREMREALDIPWVRAELIKFSKDEYDRNPYYASVINKQSEQVIGPCPNMIATSDSPEDNDKMEDSFLEWTQLNGIGKNLREFRKAAALTGLAIALKHKKKTKHPVKVSYKIYGADVLVTPPGLAPERRVFDGIEYDENWEPIIFYFHNEADPSEPTPYEANDIIWWSKGYDNGKIEPRPECVAGFTVYPFIRRFLQAAIESAEFRTSFPMALELDPHVYPANKNKGMILNKLEKFEYKPRTVPSLPVGTALKGLPQSATQDQTESIIRVMAAACALCIDMPANIALADSSNSNMASAQVDIQPWKNRVNIDRFDLVPVLRTMFEDWYARARLIRGLTPESARSDPDFSSYFPHNYVYDPLFQHPDPLKNASARSVDLISGRSTLSRMYSEDGKNARREISADAALLGISYEEMTKFILASRTQLTLQILGEEPVNADSK